MAVIARLRSRRSLARIASPRHALLDRILARSRYGRALTARLLASDLHRTPAAFVRLSVGAACAGATIAMLWAGPPAGIAGFAAGLAAPEVMIRRRIATRSARVAAQLPEVLVALGAPVRAGASLPQAFAAAAEEAEPPLRDVLLRTCRDIDAGVSFDEAVDRFAARCAVHEAVLAARAMRIGRQAGGELSRVLDEVAETLRDRERVARELHAATAQARMSAIVVAALPVVFLVLMSTGAGDQARLLFGEPIGWLLLAVGGSLEAAGIVWIRKLTSGVGR